MLMEVDKTLLETVCRILNEKRAGGEANAKKPILEKISPFLANPHGYYLHFSQVNKVGINPRSEWTRTPNGIYGWILEKYADRIKSNGMTGTFPFGDNYPFLFILKENPSNKVFQISKYDLKTDGRRDIKLLNDPDAERMLEEIISGNMSSIIKVASMARIDITKNDGAKFLALVSTLAGKSSKEVSHRGKLRNEKIDRYITNAMTKLFRDMKFDQMLDDTAGGTYYSPRDDNQNVFFHIKAFDIVISLDNKELV